MGFLLLALLFLVGSSTSGGSAPREFITDYMDVMRTVATHRVNMSLDDQVAQALAALRAKWRAKGATAEQLIDWSIEGAKMVQRDSQLARIYQTTDNGRA